MKTLGVAAIVLALTGCSSGLDPTSWTCASLVGPTIAMSRGRTPEVFEITNPQETSRQNYPAAGYRIECVGDAEWSQGSGQIEYGAHVSDGGGVMLEYRQR